MSDVKIAKTWITKAQKLINQVMPQEMQMPAHQSVVERIAILMMRDSSWSKACEGIMEPSTTIPEVVRCLFEIKDLLGDDDDSTRVVRIESKNEDAQLRAGKLFYHIDVVIKKLTRPEKR